MAKGRPINPTIKANAALQTIKGDQTVNVIASNLGVHPTQVSIWKKQLLDTAAVLFEDKHGRKPQAPD